MKLKIGLAITFSVLAIVAWRGWGSGELARPRTPASAVDAPAPLESPPKPESAAPATAPRRERVAHAPADEKVDRERNEAVVTETARVLRGRVLDLDGVALAATRVRFQPGGETPRPARPLGASTDAVGLFEIEGVPGGGEVFVDEPGLVTVISGACDDHGIDVPTVVVAARSRPLTVDVVDEAGEPVSGASVALELPDDLRSRFQHNFERSADVRFTARTTDSGRVELASAPMVVGSALRATHDGFAPARLALEAALLEALGAGVHVTLALASLASETTVLRGVVLDEFGSGVAGAAVSYGLLDTRTDAQGRFFLDLGERDLFGHVHDERRRHELVAVREGYLPASLRPELDLLTAEPIWPDPIVLQPAERPLSIAGRVLDPDERPLAGYMVFLPETHLFLGGRTLKGTIAGDVEDFVHSARSDADGRFELGGLLDQEYDLAAIDEATLLRGGLESVAAGTRDVVLRVDTRNLWRKVTGRVVDRHGAPLEEVVVRPYSETQTARGAQGIWTTVSRLEPTATNADGEFTFHDLPREHVVLDASHPDIMHLADVPLRSRGRDVDPGDDELEDVTLVVTLRLRFQVLLDDPAEADEIRVLDGDGEQLDLYRQTATSYLISSDNPLLADGRSRHLFVEDTAETLLLMRGGHLVRRVELDLEPRADNVIRP